MPSISTLLCHFAGGGRLSLRNVLAPRDARCSGDNTRGGLPLGLAGWVANEIIGVFSIQYLYASGVMFAASCALMVGVSLATRPADRAQLGDMVWSRGLWLADMRGLRGVTWYRNWLVWSAVLAIATAMIVVWWW